MSMQLTQDHRFTPEEISYLKDRDRHAEIEENARLVFPSPAPALAPGPVPAGHKAKPAPPKTGLGS